MTASGDRHGVKRGLGGHALIAELGNDPPAAFEEPCAPVAACLDARIDLLDTASSQPHVARGTIVRHLRCRIGRRVSPEDLVEADRGTDDGAARREHLQCVF